MRLLALAIMAFVATAAIWVNFSHDDWSFALFCGDDQYERSPTPPSFPSDNWIAVDQPSRLGWDEEELARAMEMGRDLGIGAIFIVDDGRLIHSEGCTSQEWYVASIRKSLMNAVIGLHIDAGRLSLETTLEDLNLEGIDPPLADDEAQTTVEALLTSSSGICRPAAAGSNCSADQAETRNVPFLYNNWDFNALLAVHNAVSDRDFFAFFEEEIGRHIGMEHFDPTEDGRYELIPESPHAAYVMDLTAADLARFGLLYLRGGRWDGQQILSEDWIRASTQQQVETRLGNATGGYGYLWWIHTNDHPETFGLSSETFSAEGNWSQAIFVIPDHSLVVVVRGYIPRLALFGSPTGEDVAAFLRLLLAAREGL